MGNEDNFLLHSFKNILEDRYSKYAKYIIQERALPDARDGLKPVQRRIIYAMHNLNLTSKSQYKKSARIVGEVIGKYHPHGDTSVYEAMVRMSQEWKTNIPLIDFQGNKGSVDGDSPAAMRYTEVRLSKAASFLLKDLNKKVVTYMPNFDDSESEPYILPSPFPNLLINGATGIAAGYATNIPPHNIGEVCDAIIYRIMHKNCSIEKILEIIKGPDFPTAGIVETETGIINSYTNGKGTIILKSKITVEDNKIVISEIPYDVNKKILIQAIDDIRLNSENNVNIKRVQDYSDKDGVSIIVEILNQKDAEYIKNYLLKKTNLQVTYNYNMTAIIDKKPKLCNIIDLLDAYIKHRKNIINRKTQFELEEVENKLDILRGLIKCNGIIDQVIKVIRKSVNKDNAVKNLISKFNFTKIQAQAIVLLRLYKLTSTDVNEVQKKLLELGNLQGNLKKLHNNNDEINKYIVNELIELKNEFSIERKTLIRDKIEKIVLDERQIAIERNVFFTVSKKGYIRLLYDNNKINKTTMKVKYNDYIVSRITTLNKNYLMLLTSKGRYFFININDIKQISSSNDFGIHISKYVKFDLDETIVNSFIFNDFKLSEKYLVLFTKNGFYRKIMVNRLSNKLKKLTDLIKIENDEVISGFLVNNNDDILSISKNGYVVRYNTKFLKETARSKKMSKFIKLKAKDTVIMINKLKENNINECLLITNMLKYKIINITGINNLKRVSQGIQIKRLNKQVLTYAFIVNENTNLISFKKDKTTNNSLFHKIYTSKRKNIFEKIPSDEIVYWNIEKYEKDLLN